MQVEKPAEIASLVRYGWGTEIKQNYRDKAKKERSSNWFHLPIPTPTYLDDDKVDYLHAYLKGEVNDHAYIKKIHVRHGGHPNSNVIWHKEDYNVTGKKFNLDFNIPDQRCTDPMVICVAVEFEDGGKITFGGAGVWFNEWT